MENNEYKGCKFVLAYFDYNDSAWYVQSRRFMLTLYENKNLVEDLCREVMGYL